MIRFEFNNIITFYRPNNRFNEYKLDGPFHIWPLYPIQIENKYRTVLDHRINIDTVKNEKEDAFYWMKYNKGLFK